MERRDYAFEECVGRLQDLLDDPCINEYLRKYKLMIFLLIILHNVYMHMLYGCTSFHMFAVISDLCVPHFTTKSLPCCLLLSLFYVSLFVYFETYEFLDFILCCEIHFKVITYIIFFCLKFVNKNIYLYSLSSCTFNPRKKNGIVALLRFLLERLVSGLQVKDCLPHLFHGFRNRYCNKISLDNMLYFHNLLYMF